VASYPEVSSVASSQPYPQLGDGGKEAFKEAPRIEKRALIKTGGILHREFIIYREY
jgi:hypothetical protein